MLTPEEQKERRLKVALLSMNVSSEEIGEMFFASAPDRTGSVNDRNLICVQTKPRLKRSILEYKRSILEYFEHLDLGHEPPAPEDRKVCFLDEEWLTLTQNQLKILRSRKTYVARITFAKIKRVRTRYFGTVCSEFPRGTQLTIIDLPDDEDLNNIPAERWLKMKEALRNPENAHEIDNDRKKKRRRSK